MAKRKRNIDREIRRKSGRMRIKALRKIYGPKFAKGFRSDMTLAALKERAGSRKLDKISKRRKKPRKRRRR